MEMEDPSHPSLSLFSSSKNVSRGATITAAPSDLQESGNRKTSTPSPSTPVCPKAEDVECLTPVGSGKRTRVSVNKCRVCRKEFKTTSKLKTHLLIHKQDGPHFCGISQKAFKQQHQITSHMSHHKRKSYNCTQSGCHKTYDNKNSLMHHCASRHGVNLTSPSSSSLSSNYDLLASGFEPIVNLAASNYLFTSQAKPVSAPVLKNPRYSGKTFGSYDTGDLGMGLHAEDAHPSQVKHSTCQESWTAGDSYKVEKNSKLLNSTQWTLGTEENPVVSQSHFDVHGLDFPESYPEELKELLSFLPNREAPTSSVACPVRPQASVSCKQHCPILLKHRLKEPRPLSKLKRRRTFSSSSYPAVLYPEPKSDFDCNLADLVPDSPPATLPNCRKRKSCSKDILSDVPAPPLPVPQPTCHKRSRPRSSYLVSPSQVALASFNTYLGKRFLQKDPDLKSTGEEPNSGCRAKSQPPKAQEAAGTKEGHDSQASTSTLDDGQMCALGTSLSPLIMPVSVPVSATKAKRSQIHKGASKKSHHLDPLNCLISSPPLPRLSSPQCTNNKETQGLQRSSVIGVYPSQLRSPNYLPDHPLSPSFHPPPYTPQPMLSPLRSGTGLYSKNLPQNQPCSSVPGIFDSVCFPINSTAINIQPRINIGSLFQAEIPPVRDTLYMLYEEHPAQLVWSPWKDISTNTETQQRVKELLDMCCSSVLPAGGTNIEFALHCLHEVQGNIMAALDLLLMRGDFRTSWHPLNDYHYTGSDHWTAQEMKVFKKALVEHDKDFQQIHNVLQTKSIAQCVEYYYNMKKLKKFKQCVRATNKKDESGEISAFKYSQEHKSEQINGNTGQKTTAAQSERCEDPQFPLNEDINSRWW